MCRSSTSCLSSFSPPANAPLEDLTSTFNRVANTPESCRDFLLSLEKSGDPRTDEALLARLRAYYDRVFSRLPVEKYGENETYAKILVRYAELKG